MDMADVRRAIGLSVFAILLAGPAQSASQSERDECDKYSDNWDRKIIVCTTVIQDSKDTPGSRALAYNARGFAYANKGDSERAILDYTEAIRLDPTIAFVYLNRGEEYIRKRDIDRAITDFNQAIRLNPKLATAHTARGIAYATKGDFNRAIASFTDAIAVDTNNVTTARYHRGIAYTKRGDFDLAIDDHSEGIRRHPDHALNFYQRGKAYHAKGDAVRAISDFSVTIRLDPKYVRAHRERGGVHAAMGQIDRAISDYSEAIRLDPKSDLNYLFRGSVAVYSGALADAQADFKKAAELDPANAYSLLWLDIAERRKGLPSRIAQTSQRIDMNAWPAPVIRFFANQETLPVMLAAAVDTDATTTREQVCEAHFYAAEHLLLLNKKPDALRLYKTAAKDCPNDFIERTSSMAALRTLGETP